MTIKPILKQLIDETSPTPALANKIEKTISRYAKPSGCCSTLVYIMNRIKNMMLSLFGCSDWQRTVRAMRKELNIIIEKKFQARTEHLGLPESLQNKKVGQINSQLAPSVGNCLGAVLKIQNSKLDDAGIKVEYGKLIAEWKTIEVMLGSDQAQIHELAELAKDKNRLEQFLKS